jgi:CRP-like cAMP-binding protein
VYGMQVPMQPQGLMGYWDHPSANDWAKVLATFPLFSGISKRRLRKLLRQATVAEYSPGDIVVLTGTPSDSFYVVLGGSAKARGKPAARTLRTGDYFGELGLLSGATRSATVVATSALHVMRLPRESFLQLTGRHPGVSFEMLDNLGRQIRHLEAQAA